MSDFSTHCAAVQLRHDSTAICVLCSLTQHSIKRETISHETFTHLCVVNLLSYWFLFSAQNIIVNSSSLYQYDCKTCVGMYCICCLVNNYRMAFYMPPGGVDITQDQYGSGNVCSSYVKYNIYLLPP